MKSSTYLPALTGVRAIAAFMVFFHHFNQESFPKPVFRILNEFHTGVTVFFVLSGFLICLRYYDTCEITPSWFKKYIKNRIARIYPMYLILTLATFAFAWYIKDNAVYGGASYPIVLIIMNVFFVRGFFDDFKFTGVAQGWSLTVEECFYFLAPLFFIRIKKNIKYLVYLPIGLISIGLILVAIFSHINFYNFYGNCTFMFLYTFTGRCIEFFLGIYLAMIALRDNKNSSRPKATLIGFVIITIAISLMCSVPLSDTRKFGLYSPIGIVSNNLILPIGIALLFYGLISEKSWIRTFLSTKTMDILGKSSYIFYLIHIGFISKLTTDFCNKNIDQFYTWMDEKEITWISNYISPSILLIFSVFIILNLISIVLYKTIEEPMNLYIRKSSLLETKKA